jgi:hypothetical protein
MSDNTDNQVTDIDDLDSFSADFFGQKTDNSESSTKEPKQVEQDSTDDEVVVEDETTLEQTPDEDDADELTKEYVEPPAKKETVQDRINALVKQREDAKREAALEIEKLRKEVEEYKKVVETSRQPTTEVAEPTPNDVNADGTPKYELGEFDPKYIRDLTKFTLEVERVQLNQKFEQERQAQERVQAQQAVQTEWNTKVQAATTEYPDLVEKGRALLANFNNLDQNYAGYLSNIIMTMDKGPDVLYYLSNHPEEAMTIVNSGAQKATLALGRIEAKFLEADQNKQAAKPKISKAPPPPSVRARGTNGAFISVAPDTDDLEAFEKEFFVPRKYG